MFDDVIELLERLVELQEKYPACRVEGKVGNKWDEDLLRHGEDFYLILEAFDFHDAIKALALVDGVQWFLSQAAACLTDPRPTPEQGAADPCHCPGCAGTMEDGRLKA